MKKITDIKDDDLLNARVLIRVDFDVPMENGEIKDDSRILASLESISYLKNKGAKIVLMAHMGRPEGKVVKEFSLLPVAKHLSKILNQPVSFSPDILLDKTKALVDNLDNGGILLLENLRFYEGEENNDKDFAKKIAALADIYVNDAFATSHRAHASMDAIPKLMDSYAGMQVQKEIEVLSKVMENPKKPVVAIVGGKKVSDKIKVLENFLNFADVILVGGGAGIIFSKAQGFDVGNSFMEEGYDDFINDLMLNAETKGVQVLIPDDVFVAKYIKNENKTKPKDIANIGEEDIIVDIGEETVNKFKEPIGFAGTIIWNGPLGIFEYENFHKGHDAIAAAVANSGAYTVLGGGDTVASIPQNLKDKFDYVSTAGGATLDFLAGKKLPGIEAVS